MVTGIQVSSLKPLLGSAAAVEEAFSRLSRMDCGALQLQWIDPSVSIDAIASALASRGLKSVSVQDFYSLVAADLPYYTGLNAATGGTWLTVSRIPEEYKSPEGLDRFIRQLRQLQTQLPPGQKLCLHPVSADYTAVTGRNAVEYILDALPELPVCADLYHLDRCGIPMAAFLRRYAGRIPMVHFKDHREGRLVSVGSGQIDWTGVVRACLEAGVEYAFVEQETWDEDPYLALEKGLRWLRKELTQI